MGVLNKIHDDAKFLLRRIEDSQYHARIINFDELYKLPILTRSGLRDTKMEKGFNTTKY